MRRFKSLPERLEEAQDQVVFWRSVSVGLFISWALGICAAVAFILNS